MNCNRSLCGQPEQMCVCLYGEAYNWASVSEPHTSVFNGEFVCAYGVRTYAHTAYRFAFQYNVSNSFRIVHVATVAAVQLA